jgi:hypothetical protein
MPYNEEMIFMNNEEIRMSKKQKVMLIGVAVGSIIVGYTIGTNWTKLRFEIGLQKCFEVSPKLNEDLKNAIKLSRRKGA